MAKFLRGQADRIKRHCATSIIQIGKALIEAKRHLSHGQFLIWVESEAGIPIRTAQAYTRIASWVSDKGSNVAHLAPSALYLLSASSTPEKFVIEILRRVDRGEEISPSMLRKELIVWREAHQLEHEYVDLPKLPTSDSAPDEKSPEITTANGGERKAVFEFVEILRRGLSDADFVRVKLIVSNHAVRSDPQFASNLMNALLTLEVSNRKNTNLTMDNPQVYGEITPHHAQVT